MLEYLPGSTGGVPLAGVPLAAWKNTRGKSITGLLCWCGSRLETSTSNACFPRHGTLPKPAEIGRNARLHVGTWNYGDEMVFGYRLDPPFEMHVILVIVF